MGEFDITRCIVCGKAFTSRTGNTFWVADASRVILGVAHLKCQRRRGSGYTRVWLNRAPFEEVRFQLWHHTRFPGPKSGAERYAGWLINGAPPADTPNDYQAYLLERWSRPESDVGAALAEDAWRRYLELVAEFRAHEAVRMGEPQGEAD